MYDTDIYGTTPKRVSVTGSFRGWDAAFKKEWELKKSGSIWSLTIENEDDLKIPAKSEFKFLIDNVQWQNLPHSPLNEKGGNLGINMTHLYPHLKPKFLMIKRLHY